MAGCRINGTSSPQFNKLREHWKRVYPHIDDDLSEAFRAIGENMNANKASRLQSGPNLEVYKYRQNSSDIKRGAKYGWRIIALYEKSTGTLYPILVYPKPVWSDANKNTVSEAIREIRLILGHCLSPGCGGTMKPTAERKKKRH